MNKIFLDYFRLSLSASLLMLPLILFKPFLKKVVSRKWLFYIYLLVVIRLLIPYGFAVKHQVQVTDGYAQSRSLQAEPPVDQAGGTGISLQTPNAQNMQTAGKDEPAVKDFMINHAVGFLWILIAFMIFVFKTAGYIRFTCSVTGRGRKPEREETLLIYEETCKKLHIKHPPKVIINEKAEVPILAGTFKQTVILPSENMGSEELFCVYRHELIHFRGGDIFYKWLVQLAVCIYWYNPLIYYMVREINQNCEFSCDEKAVKTMAVKEKLIYGDVLLKSVRIQNIRPYKHISVTFSNDHRLIKERLDSIMENKTNQKTKIIIPAALTAVILLATAFSGIYAIAAPAAMTGKEQSKADVNNALDKSFLVEGRDFKTEKIKEEWMEIQKISGDSAEIKSNKEENPIYTATWDSSNVKEISASFLEGKTVLLKSVSDEIVIMQYDSDEHAVPFETALSGGRLSVEDDDKAQYDPKSTNIRYQEIYIPEGYKGNVSLGVTNGDIDVPAYEGNLFCSVTNGGIQIGGGSINGECSIVAGKLKIEHTDFKGNLWSTEGGIEISDSTLSGSAGCTNGTVDMQLNSLPGHLQVVTTGADIHLSIPAETKFQLDATAGSQKINNEFTGSYHQDKKRMTGTNGDDQAPLISMKTTSGEITITKQD